MKTTNDSLIYSSMKVNCSISSTAHSKPHIFAQNKVSINYWRCNLYIFMKVRMVEM